MDVKTAQAKLRKLLGPNATWRDNGKITSPELRAEQRMKASALKAEYDELHERRNALMRKLLDNPEYQALVDATKRTRELMERAQYGEDRYRLTVGRNAGIGLMVRAQGDNWADVIAKLETDAQKKDKAS